ncbi:MAG TPA: reverse transcriptase domain-containing protein [Anaerolineaceae bacterium]|nr:reverse transcriptase domain-containing protein [Anaerolineaceae bacterium]
MAAGAFWLGSRWLKPGFRAVREAVIRGLQSSSGRQSLGKTAALAGGAVTLAAGGAAAIWYFFQTRQCSTAPGTGVIQGSPLSPLLANIYLHPFDQEMTRQQTGLVRYADDWLVCCPNQEQAEEAYNAAVRSLAHLRLKIHPEKTHICPPAQRLEWLGMDL